jgi:hypothetical protein
MHFSESSARVHRRITGTSAQTSLRWSEPLSVQQVPESQPESNLKLASNGRMARMGRSESRSPWRPEPRPRQYPGSRSPAAARVPGRADTDAWPGWRRAAAAAAAGTVAAHPPPPNGYRPLV